MKSRMRCNVQWQFHFEVWRAGEGRAGGAVSRKMAMFFYPSNVYVVLNTERNFNCFIYPLITLSRGSVSPEFDIQQPSGHVWHILCYYPSVYGAFEKNSPGALCSTQTVRKLRALLKCAVWLFRVLEKKKKRFFFLSSIRRKNICSIAYTQLLLPHKISSPLLFSRIFSLVIWGCLIRLICCCGSCHTLDYVNTHDFKAFCAVNSPAMTQYQSPLYKGVVFARLIWHWSSTCLFSYIPHSTLPGLTGGLCVVQHQSTKQHCDWQEGEGRQEPPGDHFLDRERSLGRRLSPWTSADW